MDQHCLPMKMMPCLTGLLPLVPGWNTQMWGKLLNPLETRWVFLFILQRFRFCLLLMTLHQVSSGFSAKMRQIQRRACTLNCVSIAGSSLDSSMQSLPEDEPITSEEVLSVAEYADDIHQHLRESEVSNSCSYLLLSSRGSHFCFLNLESFFQLRYRPKPGYMNKQPDITNSMRVILVDWLVDVSEEYRLCSETVYLAVNYLDRFLSCMSVLRGKLQLVGTAAILLAA